MASSFISPRILATFSDVVQTFRKVQEALDRLGRRSSVLGLPPRALTPLCPSFTRVSPQTGGVRCVLPRADENNAGQSILLNIENPLGDLTVFAAPNQTVNGATAATFNVAGVVELFSNGVNGWVGLAPLPPCGGGGG